MTSANPMPPYLQYVLRYMMWILEYLAGRSRIVERGHVQKVGPSRGEIKSSEALYNFNALLIKRGVLTRDMARSMPKNGPATLTASWHQLDATGQDFTGKGRNSILFRAHHKVSRRQAYPWRERFARTEFRGISDLILRFIKPLRHIPP